jgi:hypothetical protein
MNALINKGKSNNGNSGQNDDQKSSTNQVLDAIGNFAGSMLKKNRE